MNKFTNHQINMKKNILAILGLLIFCFQGIAQNHYQVRLQPIIQSSLTQSCYTIQISATDGIDLALAGQNYRLYYDASKLHYNASSSLLPDNQYINFITADHQSATNAAGMGYLPFNEEIGLISMSMDLKDATQQGIILSSDGEWTSTCEICFDRLNTKTDLDKEVIIWARKELTSGYATAYVEVAEWVDVNATAPAEASDYEDIEYVTTSTNNLSWKGNIEIYPNPVASELWIEQAAEAPLQAEIWSVNGQKLLEKTIPQGATKEQLTLGHLPSGMYQLRLTKNDQQYIHLIDKQQ